MNTESNEIILQLPEDVHKLCRTCLSVADTEILSHEITIFDEFNHLTEVAEMIEMCSSLKLDPNEGLPMSICEDCATKLQIAYDFLNQCEKSDVSLRKILNIPSAKTSEKSKDLRSNSITKLDDKSLTLYEDIVQNRDESQFDQIDLSSIFEQHQLFADKYITNKIADISVNNKNVQSQDDIMLLINNRKVYENEMLEDKEVPMEVAREIKVGTFDDPDLICPFCNKLLKNEEVYKKHSAECAKLCYFEKNEDSGENFPPFECYKCAKNFKTKYAFKVHMSNHDLKKNIKFNSFYTCDLCNKPFKSAPKLALHFYNHAKIVSKENFSSDSELLTCTYCSEIFTSPDELQNHIKHHDSAICEICSENFQNEQNLVTHLKIHGIQIAYCTICSKRFENIVKLRAHQKIHKAEKSRSIFTCPICKDDFLSAELLQRHSVQHLDEIYKCEKCKRTFNNIVSYEYHWKQHEEPKYLCSVCGKQYFTKVTLACHVRTHNNEKPYACSFCNKSFTSRSTLSVHKRIHSAFKPYVCSYCGYSCRQSGDLAMHIRTHTGDKPYKCTFPNCDRKFTTSSQRKEHYRRHTNERNHKCKDCGKAFLESKTLKVHMLIHTGEKPHGCDVCGKKFRRTHHLANHLKAHSSLTSKV